MKSSKQFSLIFAAVLLFTATARAAHVDMNDPRRALGREDDIRVDAELMHDTVSSGSPIVATCEVQNLTSTWIAIADKVVDVTYDADSRTITLSIGAEVPDKTLPRLTTIAPGGRKTFRIAGSPHIVIPRLGPATPFPRLVQIRVNVLRDISAFSDAIAKQSSETVAPAPMTNTMFDAWLDANDSIFLNALPVRWSAAPPRGMISAEQSEPTGAPGGDGFE